ncbi:MAG: hypothetical protein QOF14_4974 [Hyphomicrobiales bacterium]|jgi:hypothetical protein|nr:hypothetical protein [Hyphomicrobiales bacterium]
MTRALFGRCVVLLAIGCGMMVCALDAAQTAELPPLFQAFTTTKPAPRQVCERPRRSVVRKPPKQTAPCPECPPVQPCGSCACDITQLVEQITISNTTNTAKIENALSLGFESLLKGTVKLPDIAAGIAIIQSNVTLLADIRNDLQFVRKQLGDDQSGMVARLDGVIRSLAAAHVQLTAIAESTSTLPRILSVLNAIQADVRRMAEGGGPSSVDARLAAIIAQLEAIEKNTRRPADPPPDPPKPSPVLECMKRGDYSYYLGPLEDNKERCLPEAEWKGLLTPIEKRTDLCGKADQKFVLGDFLLEVKARKFVNEIRLVGLVQSEALTLANVEIEAPLKIEHSTFCKRVHFGNAKINHQLSFDGSLFRENLEFSNSTLGEGLRVRDAVTNSVALSSTTINGAFDFSNTVALQPWSLIGGQIGQLEAIRADVRDLNLTDIEIKRRFSAENIRVRGTLLLEGATVGSDVNLSKARLTHTTLRRAILKSDLRLQNVEARCSTKVHKAKIDGDLVIDDYAFGKVTVGKELDPKKSPPPIDRLLVWLWGHKPGIPERVSGTFHWPDLPQGESDPFAGETQQNKLSLAPNQDTEASTCEIITPEDRVKKTARFEYRSSGVLGVIDSTVGGSLCVNDVTWQRGLWSGLATRFNDANKDYDPQSVLSFDGSSVGKYTILGSIKHPKGQSDDERRIDAARLQLIGFKTNNLMSLWESSETEYKKLISQLDVQTVLKATGGCQLDDIGFSRTQPGMIATPSKASRVAGADFPNSKQLLDWLSGVEPYTSQPHAALIAALTRSGIDPVALREAKLWRDLGVDGRTWLSEPWTVSGLYNKFIDGIQLVARGVNGVASGFTLRPAGSLVLALLFVTLILLVLRRYHGRVAYLAVPKAEAQQSLKEVGGIPVVNLGLFKKYATGWRIISWPRVATLMLPRLFSAIPFLGDLFGKAPINWSSETVIGFRDSNELKAGESVDDSSVGGTPPHWDRESEKHLDELVALPHTKQTFAYLEQTVSDRWNQVRGITHGSRETYSDVVLRYLPGLIPAPQSGSLLAALRRWAWYGVGVAAVLASGVIALFKFGG